ncbi:hypothetical protein NIES4073_75370 [Kalymmatonema gypsitolerans NIES-4073]|nr:hypothetical protein NIES4073_75370 [Scytonema sp. NIES-4073]
MSCKILNWLTHDLKKAKLSKNEGAFDVRLYQGLLTKRVEKRNTSKFTDAINCVLFTCKE